MAENPTFFPPNDFGQAADPNLAPASDLEDLNRPAEGPDLMPLTPEQPKKRRSVSPWVWVIAVLMVAASALTVVLMRQHTPNSSAVTATTAVGMSEEAVDEAPAVVDEVPAPVTDEASTPAADAAEVQEVDFITVYEDVIRPAYKEMRDEQKRQAAEIESLESTLRLYKWLGGLALFLIVVGAVIAWRRLTTKLNGHQETDPAAEPCDEAAGLEPEPEQEEPL